MEEVGGCRGSVGSRAGSAAGGRWFALACAQEEVGHREPLRIYGRKSKKIICRFCPRDQEPQIYSGNPGLIREHLTAMHLETAAPSKTVRLASMPKTMQALASLSLMSNVRASALESAESADLLNTFHREASSVAGPSHRSIEVSAASRGTIKARCND